MIYKMILTDSSDTMTFNLLETPIVDKDIEGAVDNVTLDGNQYTDYLYLKKQYIQKWAIMCPDEYDELRGFYTRQFEEGEIPSYRVYYGANVTKDYIYNGDYFQFNAKGIETGMYLSQLTGNATQDGTPTPDSPVPISTVTGEQTVKVEGKNLIDWAHPYRLDSGFYNLAVGTEIMASQDGVSTITETSSGVFEIALGASWRGAIYVAPLPVGTAYRIKASITSTSNRVSRYTLDSDMKIVRNLGNQTSTSIDIDADVTLQTGEAYFAIAIGSNSQITITVTNPQLELGSTATAYEPYQGQSYTIDLGSTELAKIGTYQDRIYKDDGKWYIEKQVGKVVLDGSETSWSVSNTGTPQFLYACREIPNGTITANIVTSDKLISNYGVAGNIGANNTNQGIALIYSSTQNSYVRIRYGAEIPLADWKTKLSGSPMTIYYALATPTTTEITDDTLLSQLNFIASLYGGVNNISIVGTGAQGEMEVLIRDVLDVETDVVPETPVRLTLTDGGVINACGCRRDVQLTMRETTE